MLHGLLPVWPFWRLQAHRGTLAQQAPLTYIWRSTASNATDIRRTAGLPATVVFGARISRSTELMHVILDYNARSHMADTPVDTVFDAPQHQSRFTRPAASVCHALRYRHASTLQTAAPRSALHRSTMDGRPCTLHTTCAAQYPQSQPGLCPHFRLPIYCHTTLFHYLHLNSRTFSRLVTA